MVSALPGHHSGLSGPHCYLQEAAQRAPGSSVVVSGMMPSSEE